MAQSTVFEIPVKTVSEANLREHWAVRRKRTAEQRSAAKRCTTEAMKARRPQGRLTITLTRQGAKKMDSDNLARSMKAVRDGIADAIKRDDGDSKILWEYEQETGAKGYSVLVQIKEGG